MAVQGVDDVWTPDADHGSLQLLSWAVGEKIKGLRVTIRTGRDHSPKLTLLREINLIHCQSNQSTVGRNKSEC